MYILSHHANPEDVLSDTFTVTSNESCLSRLGGAIVGVLFGIALFFGSFPLLWWNEGRAVHRARSLEEGAGVVMDVAADTVNPGNEGKLVHVTALATTTDSVKDPDFGIAATALRLNRMSETYQWKEKVHKEKHKKLGGGEETITTYTYEKGWSSGLEDSSNFHSPAGHQNPASLDYGSTVVSANNVTFGAFVLPQDLANKVGHGERRAAQESDAAAMEAFRFKAIDPTTFYRGKDPSAPAIGDVRLHFEVTPPTTVSVVAVQQGNSFGTFHAKAGSDVLLIEDGSVPAEQMFKSAQTANTVTTWLVRAGGFFAMFLGLVFIARPLSVLASVVPFFGTMVSAGTGFVSFLVAMLLSLVTIAFAWVFYRPLLGISLLVGAAAVLYLLVHKHKKAVANTVPPPIPQQVPPPIPR